MRRRAIVFITILMLVELFLTACEGSAGAGSAGSGSGGSARSGEKTADGNSGDSNGFDPGYTYLGMGYYFEDADGYEIRLILDGGQVVDCGISSYLDTFEREYYTGFTLETALTEFYYRNLAQIEQERGESIVRLEAILGDQEAFEDYRTIYESVQAEILPDAELHSILEKTDSYVAGIEESKLEEEREKQRLAEEGRPEDGWQGEPIEDRPGDSGMEAPAEEAEESKPVSNAAELIAELEKRHGQVTLAADIVIDVGVYSYDRVTIDCDSHAVTVTGSWGSIAADKVEGGVGLCLENASSVDLQGLVVSEDCFGDIQNVIGKNYIFVMVNNTDPGRVTLPAGLDPNDRPEIVPMEGRLTCYVNTGDRNTNIGYSGPAMTYEERNELETAMLQEILINGDLDDFQSSEEGVNPEIWTDIVLDIGSVTLPNQDYQRVVIKPGGSLKLSGTIVITGGRLDWDISESGQLDITGLTLTKKHPSPDMFKIRFPAGTSIDESTLHCKASSGTIKYSMGTESFDITIW